jgi:hypothetical protein
MSRFEHCCPPQEQRNVGCTPVTQFVPIGIRDAARPESPLMKRQSIPSRMTIPNGSYQLGTMSTSAWEYQRAVPAGDNQPVK